LGEVRNKDTISRCTRSCVMGWIEKESKNQKSSREGRTMRPGGVERLTKEGWLLVTEGENWKGGRARGRSEKKGDQRIMVWEWGVEGGGLKKRERSSKKRSKSGTVRRERGTMRGGRKEGAITFDTNGERGRIHIKNGRGDR